MIGKVKNTKENYFWVAGQDGKTYFAAYPEVMEKEERGKITPGVLVEFDPMNTYKPHEEAKNIRLVEESEC